MKRTENVLPKPYRVISAFGPKHSNILLTNVNNFPIFVFFSHPDKKNKIRFSFL